MQFHLAPGSWVFRPTDLPFFAPCSSDFWNSPANVQIFVRILEPHMGRLYAKFGSENDENCSCARVLDAYDSPQSASNLRTAFSIAKQQKKFNPYYQPMVPLAYRSLHVRARNCLLIVAPSSALWNGLKAVLTHSRPKIGTARPPNSQFSSDRWNCLYREYSGVLTHAG